MSYIRPIFLIAGNTITGVLRGKVLNILIVLSAIMIIASMVTTMVEAPGEVKRMMVDSGMAAISVLGTLIAIFTGFTMIPGEVESRTAYPVLSKPVRRWQFVLGKYLGAISVNGITIGLLYLLFAVMYAIRMHEFDARQLVVVGMIFMMLVVLSSVIIFLSTFMSWIGTIVVSMGVWLIGNYSVFIAKMAEHHGDQAASFSGKMQIGLQKILPNLQAMDLREVMLKSVDMTIAGTFQWDQVLKPVGDGLIYVAIMLILSTIIFNYRELS